MVTTTRPVRPKVLDRRFKYVSRRTGRKILDRQARKYLGMSGEEFVRKYRAGEIEDPDRTEVLRVSLLIPFAER